MKKASASQTDQLEILKDKLQFETGKEITGELLTEVEEILKDIDFMSSFYTNFVGDMRIYKSQKVMTVQSSLMKILDDAIEFYKQK